MGGWERRRKDKSMGGKGRKVRKKVRLRSRALIMFMNSFLFPLLI